MRRFEKYESPIHRALALVSAYSVPIVEDLWPNIISMELKSQHIKSLVLI